MEHARIVNPLTGLMRLEKSADQTLAMTQFKSFRRMELVLPVQTFLIQMQTSELV
jgi:hypothetical protein